MEKLLKNFGVECGTKYYRFVRGLYGISWFWEHDVLNSGTTRPVITQGRIILFWSVLKIALVAVLGLSFVQKLDICLLSRPSHTLKGLLNHHILATWYRLLFGLGILDEAGHFLEACRLHPLPLEPCVHGSYSQGLLFAVLTYCNRFIKLARILERVDRNYRKSFVSYSIRWLWQCQNSSTGISILNGKLQQRFIWLCHKGIIFHIHSSVTRLIGSRFRTCLSCRIPRQIILHALLGRHHERTCWSNWRSAFEGRLGLTHYLWFVNLASHLSGGLF